MPLLHRSRGDLLYKFDPKIVLLFFNHSQTMKKTTKRTIYTARFIIALCFIQVALLILPDFRQGYINFLFSHNLGNLVYCYKAIGFDVLSPVEASHAPIKYNALSMAATKGDLKTYIKPNTLVKKTACNTSMLLPFR
jgi:hypothetical protein